MRAKLFTKEELEKGYNKMSIDGKEYESISDNELQERIRVMCRNFDRSMDCLK